MTLYGTRLATRAIALITFALTLVAAATAQEPRIPTTHNRPQPAYASIKTDGSSTAVMLKVVKVRYTASTEERTVTVPRTKTVDGKTVTINTPEKITVQVINTKPDGLKEIKLELSDVKARDTTGNPIPARRLKELLAAETPVLLATTTEPVDPFYLATVKLDTVILHVDIQKICPILVPVPMEVTNNTAGAVDVVWLPGDGTQKRYNTLKPGESVKLETFADHKWAIVDVSTKKVLREVTAVYGMKPVLARTPAAKP